MFLTFLLVHIIDCKNFFLLLQRNARYGPQYFEGRLHHFLLLILIRIIFSLQHPTPKQQMHDSHKSKESLSFVNNIYISLHSIDGNITTFVFEVTLIFFPHFWIFVKLIFKLIASQAC